MRISHIRRAVIVAVWRVKGLIVDDDTGDDRSAVLVNQGSQSRPVAINDQQIVHTGFGVDNHIRFPADAFHFFVSPDKSFWLLCHSVNQFDAQR